MLEIWQVGLLVFLFLLPMALLLDFWPHRERLAQDGRPIPRNWERQISHLSDEDDEHH